MANEKEQWKQIMYLKGHTTKNYAVSTHGRLASYDEDIEKRYLLKLHKNGGFPMATIHTSVNKSKALFVHNSMARTFLKKNNPKASIVIHLDHNKANNSLSNLKWATKKEQVEHNKKSPIVLESIARKVYNGATARKLNEKKVIQLKKDIWNPKRKLTLKQIADKYGIAEMNLYRIKNGEMWFHVHVEGEPVFPRYKEQLKNIEYHQKIAAKEQVVKDKRKAVKEAKSKAKAARDKKRELEKKAKAELRIKKLKQKAIERIAIEKRKVIRAAAAKKAKELKEKRSLAFEKAKAARAIAAKIKELKKKTQLGKGKKKEKNKIVAIVPISKSKKKDKKNKKSKKKK